MSASPTRVLVLGIDAAAPSLLRAWAADGTLPNLGSLMARGVVGSIRGIRGFFIGSTWPSFYTGHDPAGHGLHYLVQLEPGGYSFHRPAESGLVARAPFWTDLARAGRRVAILDVPLSPLPSVPVGIHVVEWGSHDSVFGFRTSPPGLAGTLRSRFGEHPQRGTCDAIERTAEGHRAFLDTLLEGVRRKAGLTTHLLREGGWDLFVQVFTEAHCAGHQCWHLHDADHPAHDPGLAASLGDPLRRVYGEIDAAVGEILEVAGDCLVFLVVPHGMGHWYGAQFLLPELLFRLGVARPPGGAKASTEGPDGRRGPARALGDAAVSGARRLWRGLPDAVREPLGPVRDRLRGEAASGSGLPTIGVDRERSRCFPHPNGLAVGGIRLNLAGREPAGILEPGAEADAFCDRLEEALLRVVDDRSGRPAVRAVHRTAELYRGEELHRLPDLLVEWSDERPVGSERLAGGAGARVRLRSPEIGVVEGVNDYGRTGEHRPGGMFVLAGPGVTASDTELEASLLDFAPSFARLLDVELQGLPGRPLDALP